MVVCFGYIAYGTLRARALSAAAPHAVLAAPSAAGAAGADVGTVSAASVSFAGASSSFAGGASGPFSAFSAALVDPFASAGRPVTCSGAFTFAGGLSLACTQPKPSWNFWFTAAAAAAVASVTFCTVSFCCTFSSTGAVCSLTLAVMLVAVAATVFVSPIFSSISISFAPVRLATRRAASVSCSRSTPCAKSSITGNSVLVQWSPTIPSTAAAISSSVAPCHRLKMRWPAGATVSVQGIT
mmetsp:Transcript_14633/g.61756  ORF Transcript_14633/g.61756 Transcript_14633/m.61756 type:complete len:240 (+) Transcript_14633:3748-4467(+)